MYYTLKYDPVFKNVFYRDKELLKIFLTNIMHHVDSSFKIKELTIRNSELTKDRLYIKNKIIDILVKTDDKVINIEINSDYSVNIKNRNFLYLCSALVADTDKDVSYKTIDQHIQINFIFQGKNKKGISIYEYRDINDEKILTDMIKTIDINVDYFIYEWYNKNKSKEYYNKYRDILIVGMEENDLLNIKDDDYMDKIVNDIDNLNKDNKFHQLFTDEEDRIKLRNGYIEEGIEQGVKQGIEQGTRQGSKEKEIDIVKNMKAANYKIEDIVKITGLSVDEIDGIS